MSFIESLYTKRKKLADVLADEEYSGIRRIVEDLYPEQAHFIYELLQNAEDTGATDVSFFLEKAKLIFEHNGHPFEEKDVEGITNIGKGGKEGQEDKIGRFGVGFKAVFAYSETPYIWSPTFSFKIEQLVLPINLSKDENLGGKTRFEFPFNNPKKSPADAFDEIATGLRELTEATLLFLHNTQSINWEINSHDSGKICRIDHSTHHVEVLKQAEEKGKASSHFLLFSAPIKIEDVSAQSVSIAYKLEFRSDTSNFSPQKLLSKQLKIVPANPGKVSVFFPAEKETSGLRFHLHAPFVPELSRASIKETSANDPLFVLLAKLAASSLPIIRDLGLLTGEFLGVLPNPKDSLPDRYKPIRQSIVNAMNNEPLTPTYSRSHAPARNLLQAKATLKKLLFKKDLEFLVEHEDEPPKWAIAASQRNSDQDRFLEGLDIKKWDVEDFVSRLQTNDTDKGFTKWLSDHSIMWYQQMYSILYKEYPDSYILYQLKSTRIVLLNDGSYSSGKNCCFPGKDIEQDENFPRVDRRIYESGKKKTQKEDARKFLEKVGVREVGEVEQVDAILESRYTKEKFDPKLNDIERFVALVENDNMCSELFTDHFIFIGLTQGPCGEMDSSVAE